MGRTRTGLLLAGSLAAALLMGPALAQPSTAIGTSPLDPSVGEQALLDAVASIPIREIDRALERFPVPYLVTAVAGGGEAITETGRAGARLRVDVDGDRATGAGGKDVEVLLTTHLDPIPHVRVQLTRLGRAPFATDVSLVASLPFDAFTDEELPGRANLLVGLRTTGDDGAAGGILPAQQTLTFTPDGLAGTAHRWHIESATTTPSNPHFVFAGHFDGDADTGVLNLAAMAAWLGAPPATAAMGIDVDHTPIGMASPRSETTIDWSAASPTTLDVTYLETESPLDKPLDTVTHLWSETQPTTARLELVVDESAGDYRLASTSAAPLPVLQLSHDRRGELAVLAEATDVPGVATLAGDLTGTLTADVSDATLTIDLEIAAPDGFGNTGALFGRDLDRLRLHAVEVPSLSVGFNGDAGFALEVDATEPEMSPPSVPVLAMAVSSGGPDQPGPLDVEGPGHLVGWSDEAGAGEAFVRLRAATSMTVDLDTASVAESLSFVTSESATLRTELVADAGSVLTPHGSAVDVSCDVDAIPAGTSAFATNFRTSFSYSSDPDTPLDSISCAGTLGTTGFEIALSDIPSGFVFAFDPDGSLTVDMNDASIGLLALRLTDPTGLFGSGELFGVPLRDTRLRLDDIPSVTASWRDDVDGLAVSLAANAGPHQRLIGGVQFAVSTEADLGDALPEPTVGRPQSTTLTAAGSDRQSMTAAFFDVREVTLDHDAATGLTDIHADTAGGRPFEFDLASAFTPAPVSTFMLASVTTTAAEDDEADLETTCTIDPLPAGTLDIQTDYATNYEHRTSPPSTIEEMVCEGTTGDVDFSVVIEDLPPSMDLLIDAAGRIAIDPDPDNLDSTARIGAITTTVSNPDGLGDLDELLGQPLAEASVRFEDVPQVIGEWSRTPAGAFDFSLEGVGAAIGEAQIRLADQIGLGDLDELVDTAISLRDVALDSDPFDQVRQLLTEVDGLRDLQIFYDPATGMLTVIVDVDDPRPLDLNLATRLPDVFGLGGPGSSLPAGVNCLIDEVPAGRTTLRTDFLSTYEVTTDPPSGIDELRCSGVLGTANFASEFLDVPARMTYSADYDRGIDLELDSGLAGGPPPRLGRATVEVSAGVGASLPDTADLLGSPLVELGFDVVDAPNFVSYWSRQGEPLKFVLSGGEETIGELRINATTSRDEAPLPEYEVGFTLEPPDERHVLRYELADDSEAGRFVVRLFGVSRAVLDTDANAGEVPAGDDDADEAAPPPVFRTFVVGTLGRPIHAIIRGVLPMDGEGGEPEQVDVDATLFVADLPSTMLLETDFKSEARFFGTGAVARVYFDAELQRIEPDPEDHPTRVHARLVSVPRQLKAEFSIDDPRDRTVKIESLTRLQSLLIDQRNAGGLGDEPDAPRWKRVVLVGVPQVVDIRQVDGPEAMTIDAAAWKNPDPFNPDPANREPDAITSMYLVMSPELPVDPDDFVSPSVPTVLRQPFDGLAGELTTADGCLIERSPFAEAIDLEFQLPSVLERIDRSHCQLYFRGGNDDFVMLQSEADEPTADSETSLQAVEVRLRGFSSLSLTQGKRGAGDPPSAGRVDARLRTVGEERGFYFGSREQRMLGTTTDASSLALLRVGAMPSELDLAYDPTGTIEVTSVPGVGRLDLYKGPPFGAIEGDDATRVTVFDTPSRLSADFTELLELAAEERSGGKGSFSASNPFQIRLLHQSAEARITAGFLIDEEASIDLDLEEDFSPCDVIAGVETCDGLLRGKADITTASGDGNGLSGFLTWAPLIGNVERLDYAADVAPKGLEYVPAITLRVRDFERLNVLAELRQYFGFLPLLAIDTFEVDFGTGGGFELGFWEPGFASCEPVLDEDGEETGEVSCARRRPTYAVDARPWRIPVFGDPVDPYSG